MRRSGMAALLSTIVLLLSFAVLVAGVLMVFGSVKFHTSFQAQLMDQFPAEFGRVKIAYFSVAVLTLVIGLVACTQWVVNVRLPLWLLALFALVWILASAGYWALWKLEIESQLESRMKLVAKDTVKNHYSKHHKVTFWFDVIQRSYKCCGYDTPESWTTSIFNGYGATSNLTSLPKSCISQVDPDITFKGDKITCSLEGEPCPIYRDGCKKKLVDTLVTYHHEMSLALCVSLLVQAASFIIGMAAVRLSEEPCEFNNRKLIV